MMQKPFSPSADRNKEPILEQLRKEVSANQTVLEIGSGTGQHACFFAKALPEITWQPTELRQNIPVINSWIKEQGTNNILEPIELDVDKPWPAVNAQVTYTCNTLHIVSLASAHSLITGSKSILGEAGKLCVYGPFMVDGAHTSESNRNFDEQLRSSNPESGVRNLTELDTFAQNLGFSACRYSPMPANNLFVVWEL